MYMSQTRYSGQEYLTIWWIGCITFLMSIVISLVLRKTVIPLIEGMERITTVTGLLLFVPFFLQICFCFLFIAGLSAIIGLCRWRKASFRLLLLGSLPMLVVFLFYINPQGIGDLHRGDVPSWSSIYLADRVLLSTPQILVFTSYLFFVLGTVALLRKLWVQRRELA